MRSFTPGQTVTNVRGVLAFRGPVVIDEIHNYRDFEVLQVHLVDRPEVWFSLHGDDVDP